MTAVVLIGWLVFQVAPLLGLGAAAIAAVRIGSAARRLAAGQHHRAAFLGAAR